MIRMRRVDCTSGTRHREVPVGVARVRRPRGRAGRSGQPGDENQSDGSKTSPRSLDRHRMTIDRDRMDLSAAVGGSLGALRTIRRVKKIALVTVVLAAALVVPVTNGTAKTTDASHCQYGKLFRGWHGVHGNIYLRLMITPRNPKTCRTWDGKYFEGGGLLFRKKLGTGVRICKLLDKTSSQSVTVAVFADTPKAGHVFCRAYHPGWPRL